LIVSDEIARVGSSVRKFVGVVSNDPLTGCYFTHMVGQALLHRLGVRSDVHIGYSAWRTGPGPLDGIACHPEAVFDVPLAEDIAPRHCWLWLSDAQKLLDYTTYLLGEKIARLNQADGRHRTVAWPIPDYLLADKSQISTLDEVCRGGRSKSELMFYYKRRVGLEAQCKLDVETIPEHVFERAYLLFEHPDLEVVRTE
jgi:hypothetical protein